MSAAVEVDGVRAPLLQAGPEDAREAVVYVHGNPGSGRDWQDLLRRTGEFARSIALDMPGFGRASKPRDFDYTIEGYAAFLAEALRKLGVDRAHLVLHDFGGAWGLGWAASEPERVGSITLVDTGMLVNYRWHVLARVWRRGVLGDLFMAATTRTGFRQVIMRANPPGLPRGFVDAMYDDYDRATRRAVLRLYRATPEDRMADLEAVAALRDKPVLVVWGAGDPYIGVEHAEGQRRAFPGARVATLDDSGHWPHADDPDGVAQHVVPFLREQAGAAATTRP